MEANFYAMLSRMKYIERWALMRNSRPENVSEHTLEVSILSHALSVIGNKRLGKNLNGERAALIALFHDSTEIITGDMPTPIKYHNGNIQGAFKEIEEEAANRLLHMLPEDFWEEYEPLYFQKEEDTYLWKLVKAADKLSALIKCIQEEKAGNTEFANAKESIVKSIEELDLEEAKIFMVDFLPSYYRNLDELTQP